MKFLPFDPQKKKQRQKRGSWIAQEGMKGNLKDLLNHRRGGKSQTSGALTERSLKVKRSYYISNYGLIEMGIF
jgi:predicted component of type VI protein secretion system